RTVACDATTGGKLRTVGSRQRIESWSGARVRIPARRCACTQNRLPGKHRAFACDWQRRCGRMHGEDARCYVHARAGAGFGRAAIIEHRLNAVRMAGLAMGIVSEMDGITLGERKEGTNQQW